ncbi:MAG: hypothetical protein BWY85_01320 [Firmicutes bacterium ADurb.Bin506]|nr:MAG: hypothetical protein BWY85_01320 [Firmicutes bacterium ADurb.Bin506]
MTHPVTTTLPSPLFQTDTVTSNSCPGTTSVSDATASADTPRSIEATFSKSAILLFSLTSSVALEEASMSATATFSARALTRFRPSNTMGRTDVMLRTSNSATIARAILSMATASAVMLSRAAGSPARPTAISPRFNPMPSAMEFSDSGIPTADSISWYRRIMLPFAGRPPMP